MKAALDPEYKEEILGKAEIRETFKVPNRNYRRCVYRCKVKRKL